ncbi:hypothetical protein PGLA_21105 [Paenibacillus glacialis]|uniref:Bacterial EndoU nuclease domain-containing protein n=1 Tax=Paenibacillus glacialis TaxID=494026 RepID=A0A168F784_9BACL|nr:hypothetical protein PGLA_21105 [Paenibacillus glacialis]
MVYQAAENYTTNETLQVVWPYGAIRIEQLKITHQVGEHVRLRLMGRVAEEMEEEILMKSGLHDCIEVYDSSGGGAPKPLFLGQIHHISIQVMHEQYQIVVEAISHTYNMDTLKKKRSFQHVEQQYTEIFDEVVASYTNSDYIDHTFNDRHTGKLIMQYEETDWSFLKRLASHAGVSLIADITAHKPRFWIGIPEGRNQIILKDSHPFEVTRRIQAYLYTTSSNHIQNTQNNTTTYTFEWMSALDIGDEVIKDGDTYIIAKRRAEMRQGQLIWTYECGPRAGYNNSRIHNTSIIGAAINGTIIGVSRQQVKVHLDMDADQNPDAAQWFPYAAEGNQVWYMMPEKGSKVKLYFPSREEDEALVIQSVRQEPGVTYAEKHQQKMADPGVKTFGNPQGKEFTLGDKELNITGMDGQLYIGMNSYTGVNLAGSQQVRILATGSLQISGDQVEVKASESLSLERIADTLEAEEGSAPVSGVTGTLALGEDISSKSELIAFASTGEREEYEPILSEFEKDVQKRGIEEVRLQKFVENYKSRSQGSTDAGIEALKGLWGFVVDVADMGYTTAEQILSPLRMQSWDEAGQGVQDTYEFVSGKKVAPLEERNDTLKAMLSGIGYTWDLVNFKKSKEEILEDTKGMLTSAKESIVDPAVASFKGRSLSYYTSTKEENYDLGYAQGQTTLVVAEVALTVASEGASLASKVGRLKKGLKDVITDPKKAIWDTLGPNGKLFGKGKVVYDGRFKTRGTLFERVMESLGDTANKMKKSMIRDAPYHVLIRETTAGINSLDIVKNEKSRFFSMDGDGPGGKKRGDEGTGNVKFPDLYSNWKWDVPKSLPTYGHAYSKHGSHIPDAKLKARAINDKVQIGRWDNQKDAAKLISEVAKQGPGVYDIELPSNVGGTSFLKTGEKVPADRAIIVVREDNSITSAYPYNSSHPTKPER